MVAGCRSYLRIQLAYSSESDEEPSASYTRPGGPGNQYHTVSQLSFGLAAVLAVESFDAAGGIDQLLFAREERVTTGAYLEPDLRLGRTRLPGLTARAMDGGGNVLWMYISLHFAGHSC